MSDSKNCVVKRIMGQMSLEEKASIIVGETTYGTCHLERFGLPSALLQDAGNGVNLRQYLSNLLNTGKLKNDKIVNRYGGVGARGIISELVHIMNHIEKRDELDDDENALLDDYLDYIASMIGKREFPNSMPCNSMLAATWDKEAVYECGKVVGREASAYGIDCLLGTPCINIQRDPLAGRGFECYSEDPYLTAELSPWHCIGVQEMGVAADVKHLAANNQETDRKTINEIISERALREIYFPGFEAVVKKGKIKSVMTGYNWINSEACAHNRWMIKDVLRGEWGYQGCVVSDWGGVYDQVKAVKAGNDLTMPKGDPEAIVRAVKNNEISQDELDACVENVLNFLVDLPMVKGRRYTTLDNAAARRVAYRAASEGTVLLKNNDTLPIAKDAMVAFYGSRCERFTDTGVGSGCVHTDKTSNLVERAIQISNEDRVLRNKVLPGTYAVVVTLFAKGQEGQDRPSFCFDQEEIELLKTAHKDAQTVGAKLVVILNIAGPTDLREVELLADAILCVYFPGEEGANAAGDILYGVTNPSGKLPHTFPKKYSDCPSFGNFPGENKNVLYGEGILVGYRWYDTKEIEPLYSFGHGLSYTRFELSDVRLSSENPDIDTEKLKVTVNVKNIGGVRGREIVQLYVADDTSTLFRPVKELKGFASVELEPGENRDVEMELDARSFSAWDPSLHTWTCEPGVFTLMIGESASDIRICKKVNVHCKNPYGYGASTSYRVLIEDERSLDVIASHLPKDSISRDDLAKQMVYFGQTMDFRQAYPQYISLHFHGLSDSEKWKLFDEICEDLEKIDVTEYSEKETF